MTRFYFVYDSQEAGASERVRHLGRACDSLGLAIANLDSRNANYAALQTPGDTDCLYNVTRQSYALETLMLNQQVKTFYRHFPSGGLPHNDSTYAAATHQQHGLPCPRTIFHSTADRTLLSTYAEVLGFPIVIKVARGTLGIGTMLAPDSASLFALCDYLVSSQSEFILRSYVAPREIARLITVGNVVVASNAKLIPAGDFRSSVKHCDPIPTKYDAAIEALAVRATVLSNVETAGVDILIAQDGSPYLLEVNTPHDFVTTARVTGVDVALHMVSHLLSKVRT